MKKLSPQQASGLRMNVAGVVALVGCGLIVRGAGMAWRPAGWLLSGLFLAVPSIFVAYAAFREK